MTAGPQKRQRYENPDHARYLTFSCFNRRPLFDDDQIKAYFVSSLERARARHRFHLWAWVVMPEHAHLLLWPRGRATASAILQSIKQPVAQRAGRRFWLPGGGHDRNVYSRKEILKKIEYTHENPVRRRLVARALDWKWSSATWYAGGDDALLQVDPLPQL